MQVLNLQGVTQEVFGEIVLTGSKSESNRALILQALAQNKINIENLSEAEDTVGLIKVLERIKNSENQDEENGKTVDVGPAGTAMRFLTSYLSLIPGKYLLTGSERMKERPIGILVNALKELGAQIAYGEKEGFPPLIIEGSFKQVVNHIQIEGSVSSQYISSLLLIANSLPNGLKIEILGGTTSKPYLTMTLQMLEECGIKSTWDGNIIHIEPQSFNPCTLYIEPDWSAASYWYSLLALAEKGEIFLKGLKNKSLQGDCVIVDFMKKLGVNTEFKDQGIQLTKIPVTVDESEIWDLKECPDLAQTLIVCAAALRKNLSFTGLHTLRIKETDRIQALQNELIPFGVVLNEKNEVFTLDTTAFDIPDNLVVETYEDHRMAMAFAPLIMKFPNIQILEPQVVGKSYPNFWKDLKSIGIEQKTLS